MRTNKWYSIEKDGYPKKTGIYVVCHTDGHKVEEGKTYMKDMAGYEAESKNWLCTFSMESLSGAKIIVHFRNITHWMLPSEPKL